jgi:hypothetical protein
MAHEVAPRFLDRRIKLPPTVKMPNLGFLVSEQFFPNGKKIRFPSISDGGKNERCCKSDYGFRKRKKESTFGVKA